MATNMPHASSPNIHMPVLRGYIKLAFRGSGAETFFEHFQLALVRQQVWRQQAVLHRHSIEPREIEPSRPFPCALPQWTKPAPGATMGEMAGDTPGNQRAIGIAGIQRRKEEVGLPLVRRHVNPTAMRLLFAVLCRSVSRRRQRYHRHLTI